VLCDNDRSTIYNVELKDGVEKVNGKNLIKTFFAPVPMELGKEKVDVFVVDCEGQEPYRMQQEELE
jgi:hypothetical protein